jgi:hypothetical protein
VTAIYNGPNGFEWRKAARSMNNGNCAEIGTVADAVLVRDSKDRAGVVLLYPAHSWLEFVREARMGRFDGLRLPCSLSWFGPSGIDWLSCSTANLDGPHL